MRVLWRDDPASFAGEFVSCSEVRVFPKPMRDGRVPVVVGGNSDAALRRVAQTGDGWYGFNVVGVEAVRERLGLLAELGVDELVLVEVPPDDPQLVDHWIRGLASRWGIVPV